MQPSSSGVVDKETFQAKGSVRVLEVNNISALKYYLEVPGKEN